MASAGVTEPVNFTANAARLVIRSIKATYEVLSNVKDGPQQVKRIFASLQQMQETVEGLRQRDTAGIDVAEYLQLCELDLKEILKRLSRFAKQKSDGGLAGLNQFAKRTLHEDELEQISDIISNHVQILILIQQKENRQIAENRDIQTAAATEIRAREIHRLHKVTNSKLRDLTAKTDIGIQDLAKSYVDSNAASSAQNAALLRLVEQISAKVDRVVTAVNSSDMATKSVTQNEEESQVSAAVRCNLIINQLCDMIPNNEHVAESKEAKKIIQYLQYLITAIQELSVVCSENEEELYTVEDSKANREALRADLARSQRALAEIRSIIVNKRFEMDSENCRRPVRCRRTEDAFDFNNGHVKITTRKQTRKKDQDSAKSESGSESDFEQTIVFRSKVSRPNHRFSLSVLRRAYSGRLLLSSRITVNNICASSKPVFKALRRGDVCEFFTLLRDDNDTSIRDCDERGASLLFYAFGYPDVFKFLIQSGLDVDAAIEYADNMTEDHIPYLGSAGIWTSSRCQETAISAAFIGSRAIFTLEQHDSLNLAVYECYRLFLEAGGDPTIRYHGIGSEMSLSAWDAILSNGTWVSYLRARINNTNLADTILDNFGQKMQKMILDSGSPFLDLEFKDMGGQTALLRLLRNGYPSFGTIALLLDRGASVNARDTNGNSCLHTVFQRRHLSVQKWPIIMLFLNYGANVFAANNEGQSVLDAITEYNTILHEETDSLHLSFHQDILLEDLDSFGIPTDVPEFYSPRGPHFICPHWLGFSQSTQDSPLTWRCYCSELRHLWPIIDDFDRGHLRKYCPPHRFNVFHWDRPQTDRLAIRQWSNGPDSLFDGTQRQDIQSDSSQQEPTLDSLFDRQKVILSHYELLRNEAKMLQRDTLIEVERFERPDDGILPVKVAEVLWKGEPTKSHQVELLKQRVLEAFTAKEQLLELFARRETNLQLSLRRFQLLQFRARQLELHGIAVSERQPRWSLTRICTLMEHLRESCAL